jgi:predicted metal-dependent hydrolase
VKAPAQLSLPWRECQEPLADRDLTLIARSAPAPIYVRNGRARRYILRVLPDATIRVTIPRHGSRREAEAFVRTRTRWIADRRQELETTRRDPRWRAGQRIWWRGVPSRVEITQVDDGSVLVRCGEMTVATTAREDYRPVLEPVMRSSAVDELPGRLLRLAATHGLEVARVTVRNQRSRWGSCSRDGTIALNWRLLQMPTTVCDYVLLHELMHLREPNHSPRFWAQVASVCPDYAQARAWLRVEGLALC